VSLVSDALEKKEGSEVGLFDMVRERVTGGIRQNCSKGYCYTKI